MPTLIEAALRVCREICDVKYGVATGGSTTTLVDTNLQEFPGNYDNGVLWLLTGDNAGSWHDIITFSEGTVTINTTLTSAIDAGDKYAIVADDIDKSLLTQAVNAACKSVGKVLMKDETVVVVSGKEEYALPAGVSDVRRVEEATTTVTPFTWEINAYWQEIFGTLVFHPDHLPENAGNKLRISYAAEHPEVYDTTAISWDSENILWAAALFIMRRWNINTGKDKEWLAEQVSKAEIANATAMRFVRRPPNRDLYMVGPF